MFDLHELAFLLRRIFPDDGHRAQHNIARLSVLAADAPRVDLFRDRFRTLRQQYFLEKRKIVDFKKFVLVEWSIQL